VQASLRKAITALKSVEEAL